MKASACSRSGTICTHERLKPARSFHLFFFVCFPPCGEWSRFCVFNPVKLGVIHYRCIVCETCIFYIDTSTESSVLCLLHTNVSRHLLYKWVAFSHRHCRWEIVRVCTLRGRPDEESVWASSTMAKRILLFKSCLQLFLHKAELLSLYLLALSHSYAWFVEWW